MKENIKTKDATKREIIGSAQNKTRQTHLRATLIFPTKCIIKAIDATKNNNYRVKKHYTIKLCAKLTTKLLTTSYKSKILKFKLDEDPLQRWICCLTFIESLEMIFS